MLRSHSITPSRHSRWWITLAIFVLIAPGCLSTGSTVIPTPSSSEATQTKTTTAATATGSGAARVDLSTIKVSLKPVFTGLDQPVFFTNAGDGSGDIFIVEKAGKILLAKNGKLQTQPFLDITSRVKSSGSEQGLLSVAFHPSYKSNGFFYVYYIDTFGNTVVARFTANQDRNSADPTSFKEILGIKQPYSNHNGGQLAFGPRGLLWIGVGDGGSEGDPRGNGQNTNTLLGKILRIDVDHGNPYSIPPNNPFVNGKGGKPEIWAYGLRNPWRFSFDSQTHDLYIGDVGQNQWEEIDFVPSTLQPGFNFGWKVMEGTHCYAPSSNCDQAGLTLPVAEYSHTPDNCAVMGGYVYRGSQFRSIAGVYFFGDYCSGRIWGMDRDAGGKWITAQVGRGGAGFSAFGEDGSGEIYVCDLDNGTIYHLTVSG